MWTKNPPLRDGVYALYNTRTKTTKIVQVHGSKKVFFNFGDEMEGHFEHVTHCLWKIMNLPSPPLAKPERGSRTTRDREARRILAERLEEADHVDVEDMILEERRKNRDKE